MAPVSAVCDETVSCDPLVDALRETGPLSNLFLRAATHQVASVRATLQGPHSQQAVLAMVAAARRRIDREAAESPLADMRQCSPGCTACCHTVTTDCTPLEALALAVHLRDTLSPDDLNAVMLRLAEVTHQRSRMTPAQRSTTRLRCGLLNDQGRCAGYAARPLACAGAFSFCRQTCHAAWHEPELVSATATLDHALKVWTMGISGGLQRALAEAGYDANLYELNSILLRALDHPRALELWLAQEDVFAECLCTDPHSPPRKAAVLHKHGRIPARPTRMVGRGAGCGTRNAEG